MSALIESGVYPKEQNTEQKTNSIQDSSIRGARFSINTRLAADAGEADISGAEAGETKKLLVREALREELLPLSELVINQIIAEYEQLVNHYSKGEAGKLNNRHRTPAEKKAYAAHGPRMKAIADAQKMAAAVAESDPMAEPISLEELTAAAAPQAFASQNTQGVYAASGLFQNLASKNGKAAGIDMEKMALTKISLQQELSQGLAYDGISIDSFFNPQI